MILRYTISIVCACLCQWTFAQTGTADSLSPADLDYYLYQAVSAPGQPQRLALNHIGIQGQTVEGGYLVTAVLEDYPAQRAGIYRGDIITEANGAPFHAVYSFNDRNQAPAGFTPNSEAVSLQLERGDNQLSVELVPVFENLFDSYRSAMLNSIQQFPSGNKTVGYVRLWVLSRATSDLISYQLLFRELADADGIIIDLRDSLGYLDSNQLQLLYRGASNLFTRQPSRPTDTPVVAFPVSEPYRNPVAILVNGKTRGGSELLAYQLGKLDRVITLGSATAGRIGSWSQGNESLQYSGNNDLIDGLLFEGNGYAPERQVSYPQTQAGRIDPQFQAAMDLLMGII